MVKKILVVIVILILISLAACNLINFSQPTPISSPPVPEKSSPTLIPSPTLTLTPSPNAVKISSPVPTALPVSHPTQVDKIDPFNPPDNWMPLRIGIAMIYLPRDMTILTSEDRLFLADLPVVPGTDQLGRSIFLINKKMDTTNCGFETPSMEKVVTDSDGFQYTFQNDYRQEVVNGHTIESLSYWKYDYGYCVYIELTLESGITGTNGDPLSAFDLQGENDLLETILSTYRELG